MLSAAVRASIVEMAAILGMAALLLWPTASAGQEAAGEDAVRVRLMDRQAPEQSYLRAEGGPLQLMTPVENERLLTIAPGETFLLGTRGAEVYARQGARGLYAPGLYVAPSDGARWSLSPSEDGPYRSYGGTLLVTTDPASPEVLQLVNGIALEDYVASVVASEYTLDDQEGAKAMAVVARTYALRTTGKFGDAYQHVDHTRSQLYGGLNAITPAARQAARATRGEVLTYDSRLVEAVYFSSSGGHTANNEDVWDADTAKPYLRGKKDPYDTQSPHQRWTATVLRTALLDALSAHHDMTVEGFLIDERSEDGRVQTIELLTPSSDTPTMRANNFRLLLNEQFPEAALKSTLFEARRVGDRYVFEGRGYGHGVGLSQWGAHAMAEQGGSYRDILSFYYTGATIQTLDSVDATAPLAQTPAPESTDTRRIGW